MANRTLKRQIDRAKTELAAFKPEPTATVLIEPLRDADPSTTAAFLDQLANARTLGGRIIVVRAVKADHLEREEINGVRYVRSEWEAQFTVLAGQPSEQGNKNRLADLLQGLGGNVLGVTANPARGKAFQKGPQECAPGA